LIGLAIWLLPLSCVRHGAEAGVDADSSIAALRVQVEDLNSALVQWHSTVSAGGNIHQNDDWTLRLLGLGLVLMGLSYPVGKLVWLISGNLQRKARWLVLSASRSRRAGEAPTEPRI
jgi:hypothetical protein